MDFYSHNKNTENYSNKKFGAHFPVFWQLSILVLLLFAMFFSGLATWLQQGADESTWVERTPVPQQNSILTTTTPLIEDVSVTAKHIFVYDLRNNRVIFQKQPDEIVPLASITKLMTSLIASEILAEEAIASVPMNAVRQQSASGLRLGERLTTEALTDFSMIASSNDAAYTLAAAVGETLGINQSEAVIVEMMNQRAEELDLPSLRFYNATGLDVSSTQAGGYGTARDVTFLMSHLYREHPHILEASREMRAQIPTVDGGYHNALNTNRILSTIPNIIGTKTGYTDLAGGNLTIMFDAGFDRPIIVTVLGSTFFGRFDDMATLIEAITEALKTNV